MVFLPSAWSELGPESSLTNKPIDFHSTILVPQPAIPTVIIPKAVPVNVPSGMDTAPQPTRPPASSNSPFRVKPGPIPPTAHDLASRTVKIVAPPLPNPVTTPATIPVEPPPAALATTKPLPPILRPTLFDTPEADAILAAMQIFPTNNVWHADVRHWPVHPNSPNILTAVGSARRLDFNLDMGFVIVPKDASRVSIHIAPYDAESDLGPYPLPENVPIEGWPALFKRIRRYRELTLDDVQRDVLNQGGDRHAIVVDPTAQKLYEFFSIRKTLQGWQAAQASIFDLSSNALRPDGWTSADAAGLPIFPAVVRYDELVRGEIDHALRVTVPRTRKAYVAPATHYASSLTDVNLPRMGERFRLRANYDLSKFSPEVQTILNALKKHGAFVADNGAIFAISITPDERMPNVLDELNRVTVADFEIVTAPE